MRFTLAQLRKLKFPYIFDETIDLSELDGFENIVKVTNCNVKEEIWQRSEEEYFIKFEIKANLLLSDSLTLEEINFPVDIKASEIFSSDENNENAFLISGITLDTKEAIISNILINKPINISNAEYFDSDIEEDDDNINPAFASLKDLL